MSQAQTRRLRRPSHRTRSLILIAFGHFVIELSSNFLPVIYPLLRVNLALSYTQVGLLALVASMGTSLAQPLFGYLSDRWEPHWMSAISIAWIGLVMGLVGSMKSYGLVMFVIALGVLGSAAFHPSGATFVSAYDQTKRGRAASVFSVGGNLGSALSPVLITAGMGWFGLRGTALVIPLALVYAFLLSRYLGKIEGQSSAQTPQSKNTVQDRNFAGLALIVLTVMCMAWFHHAMRTYLPIWLESRGHTLATSGTMLFVYLFAAGIGSLIGGAVSDNIGRWQLFVVCMGLLGPVNLFFVAAAVPGQWMALALMGALIGAMFPVSIVLAQETWPSGIGIASGLVMGIGWLPGGIGASVTGYVADRLSLALGLRLLSVPAVLGTLLILIYAGWFRNR